MPAQKKTQKERDLEKTRQLILDAAAEEFSMHGFSGARVDRISRRAGCNKAMIYYIYKNKNELHLSVLENLFEEKVREVDAHLRGRSMTLENLFPMLRVYFKTLLEKRDYASMILYDVAAGAETLRALKQRRPDLFAEFDSIADMLRMLQDTGLIADIEPEKSVVLIVLIVVGLASLLPHMDLVAAPDSPRLSALASSEEWLAFLGDMFLRILAPDKQQ